MVAIDSVSPCTNWWWRVQATLEEKIMRFAEIGENGGFYEPIWER